MKKIRTISTVLATTAVMLLASCKKDETQAVVSLGNAGAVTASSTTIVLDKSKVNVSDTSVLFTVTSANFGYNAAVTTVLQIDSLGDNWKKPQSYTLTAGTPTQFFSTLDFNSLLLKMNMPTGKSSQVQVRAIYTVSANVASIISPAITLTVTPFSIASSVYVPGAYQGWAPSSADSLVSPISNGIYTGIIDFTGADLEYKITTAPNWNATAYGAGATAGTVSPTGGNIIAPTTGGLMLTLNTNDLTLKVTPQWSIIGDATAGGWGTDTDMYIDKTTNTWYITATLTSDGSQAIKFRFANDWTVNLGGSNGTLSQGGSNITIPATAAGGNSYKITLDPVKNTYTLVKL